MVLHTAEFEARRTAATVELYKRLTTGRGLLPPAIGFVFDREGRSEAMRADLARHGNVFLLPRRMYENYLLNPAAIAGVASSIEGFSSPPIDPRQVEGWLAKHRWDRDFFDPMPTQQTDDAWLRDVRGDRVLTKVFSQLSEQRVQYDKVRDGVALTEWLLEHSRDDLREVAQVIADASTPKAR